MNKFHCEACGNDFEAKRNYYAHCPKCGKNAHRVYENESPPTNPTESTGPITTTTPPEEVKPVTKEEVPIKPPEGDTVTTKTTGSRRIVVRRVTKKTNEKTPTTTTKQPSTTPINKKVKVTKGITPTVKKKVRTTKQRKEEREAPETSTHWKTLGRISGFIRK